MQTYLNENNLVDLISDKHAKLRKKVIEAWVQNGEEKITDTESYMWDITLKDRIQYGNLREYFNKKLAASEKNKINTNEFYLH